MEGYLDRFVKEQIAICGRMIASLPLLDRTFLQEKGYETVHINFGNVFEGRPELIIPDIPTSRRELQLVYASVAQLGRDLAYLVKNESARRYRVVEDCTILFSEIGALFGQDKELSEQQIREHFAIQIGIEERLRLSEASRFN